VKIVDKAWGKELWLEVNDKYAMKILSIDKGCSISLQYHKNKTETWYIAEGKGEAIVGNSKILLEKGSSLHLPAGVIHKITAITPMKIVEASTPELDDVIRLD
jgi:mannose-1-phosphate guanylyltransferase